MRKNSSSSLFLMELILAILFFSLASTVCIKLFVQSHLLSKSSVNLNNAVLWCQNLAEGYNGLDGDLSGLSSIFPSIVTNDSHTYTIYFDKDWNVLDSDSNLAMYYASILQVNQEPLRLCQISCVEKETESVIYKIDIKKYISQEATCQ